jgi:general secretion pathway protein A
MMFLKHFQMSDNPFSERPPYNWILCDERFERALARLKFFIDQGRLALIIGQTGVGKSSLLRLFKRETPQNRYQPVFFHITNVSPNAFLRMIVTRLGEAPKLGKDRLFLQIMDRIKNNEAETILIIDEAHLLPSQALTDLRLLISAGTDTDISLKIVLSGQEPLAALLKRNVHADLVGRINVQFRLNALTKIQTLSYIDHRLKCAGASEKCIDSESKELIHDYSGGIPRLINNIATACLINAASKSLKQVSVGLVNETMAEFRLP